MMIILSRQNIQHNIIKYYYSVTHSIVGDGSHTRLLVGRDRGF